MSLEIALSGIHAINDQLDAISHNISNAGTYGFKSSRTNFAALYAGSSANGVEVSSTTQSLALGGSVLTTGGKMDVSIAGAGYFVSRDASGQTMYSRVGIFSVDKTGFVVDAEGRRAQGYAAPLAGSTAATGGAATLGAMGDLTVPTGQIAAKATTALSYVGNLSSDWAVPTTATFDATDSTSFNSSVVSVVHDSLGSEHTLTQYFVKTGVGAVKVHYALDGTTAATPSSLTFDTAGQLTAPTAAVTLALGTPTGAAALSVAVDYEGSTQFAGDSTTNTNAADGYASGSLTSVQIGADGRITAAYSNDKSMTVGTLALATFPDEGGLKPVSGTAWVPTDESGSALLATPGGGQAAALTTGSLEQSNVDITSELVSLMTSQRNYQANSKVITTESAMLQSLMQAV
jgi:flagellar hook protein FlgE